MKALWLHVSLDCNPLVFNPPRHARGVGAAYVGCGISHLKPLPLF